MMIDFQRLTRQLGLDFDDYSLLARALTHSSYLNENPNHGWEDNERLEFLGDAVLDFAVGAFLYHRFPELREGELTMLRAALVRTETLAEFARDLGLGEHLLLGVGEAESGGRERSPILCAAFEALVGAVFLDRGLSAVEPWLHDLMTPALKKIMAEAAHKDAKSEFQIWAQGIQNVTPHYEVVAEEGPDHAKLFTVVVLLDEETWGVGHGRSKQVAAQAAAAQALTRVSAMEDGESTSALLEADG